MKKIAGESINLNVSKENHKHMRYGSKDTEWVGQNNPENQTFEKIKKIWRCHHLTNVYQNSWS